MTWKKSAAAIALMEQLNARYPNRDKASDGSVGDLAHRARKSDHNPNKRGYVLAQDIDENFGPESDGGTAEQFTKELLEYAASGKPGADRIKNVVYENRVASGTYKDKLRFWRWRKGSYGHTHHIHISFTEKAEQDGRPFPLPCLKIAKKAKAL